MDTLIEVKTSGLPKKEAERGAELVFAEFQRIDKLMSRYQEESSLSDFNNRTELAHPVDPELYELLMESVRVSRQSQGAFDVTIEPLLTLYSFDERSPRIPSEAALKSALSKIGYQKLSFEDNYRINSTSLELRLDLGAIAKGYALKRAAAGLERAGFRNFLINAGGDILTRGQKKDGSKWRLGIRNPRGLGIIGKFEVTNTSVVTSGDYERFFFRDGQRIHHLLDPRNGRPASLCRSVTVVYEDAALADAYATAIFVLGPNEGMRLAEKIEGLQVLIISTDGTITSGGGFSYEAK